jgi:hypothetical protein
MKTVKENVQSNVQEELLSSKQMPTTSNEFRMNCNLFKNVPEKMWIYMKNSITPKGFASLYKKSELEPELLMLLITGLEKGQKTDPFLCAEYLSKFVQTKKFSICRSFLNKAEKKRVTELVMNLES